MADEKKAPEAPKEQVQVPQVASAPDAKAPLTGAGKKNKKISQMTLKEIDEKLISVKEKMGRLDSRYAKELLGKKDELGRTVAKGGQ